MAKRNLEHAHIVDLPRDMASGAARLGGVKVCGGAACGFSDASTSSGDAKERSASRRKLFIALLFCLVFMGVEVVGGVKANSLAILTDAAHLSSDVSTYAISLFSLWAAGWEATPRQSYGFFRVEILGALASMLTIWLLTGMLVFKAIDRFVHDCGEVQGFLMFVIASIALAVNIGMAVLLGHEHGHDHVHQGHDHNHSDHSENRSDHGHEDHDHSQNHSPGGDCHHEDSAKHIDEHHHLVHLSDLIVPLVRSNYLLTMLAKSEPKQKKQWNINLQGAYLHALGDSIQSLGVVIGGGIIWYRPEWKIVDLICTLTFSVIVLYTTFTMLRNIIEVLMESTPRGIDAIEIEKGLCEMEEVVAIHELHIWAITVGKVSLGCHVRIKPEADDEMVLGKVTEYIRRKHNINHVTIQIERW